MKIIKNEEEYRAEFNDDGINLCSVKLTNRLSGIRYSTQLIRKKANIIFNYIEDGNNEVIVAKKRFKYYLFIKRR